MRFLVFLGIDSCSQLVPLTFIWTYYDWRLIKSFANNCSTVVLSWFCVGWSDYCWLKIVILRLHILCMILNDNVFRMFEILFLSIHWFNLPIFCTWMLFLSLQITAVLLKWLANSLLVIKIDLQSFLNCSLICIHSEIVV